MQAYEFGLNGVTFNAYGAAGLHFRGLDGRDHVVSQGGHQVIDYARATDLVSSANLHFGEQRIRAAPQDIDALRAGRYLDATPDPAHPTNPLLTFSVAAHKMGNFLPGNGIVGESIISEQGEKLYQQNKVAIDHYRHDVLTSRMDLHQALQQGRYSAPGMRVEAKIDDAIDVARFGLAADLANHVLIKPVVYQVDRASNQFHSYGEDAHVSAERMVHNTRAAGHIVQHDAEQISRGAAAVDQNFQQAQSSIARGAISLSRFDPALTAVVLMQAQQIGRGFHAIAQCSQAIAQTVPSFTERTARDIHDAGQLTRDVFESASVRAHGMSQSLHDKGESLGTTQTHDAIVDTINRVQQAAHHARERLSQRLVQAGETLTHPGSWFESKTAEPTAALSPPLDPPALRDFRHAAHPLHERYQMFRDALGEQGFHQDRPTLNEAPAVRGYSADQKDCLAAGFTAQVGTDNRYSTEIQNFRQDGDALLAIEHPQELGSRPLILAIPEARSLARSPEQHAAAWRAHELPAPQAVNTARSDPRSLAPEHPGHPDHAHHRMFEHAREALSHEYARWGMQKGADTLDRETVQVMMGARAQRMDDVLTIRLLKDSPNGRIGEHPKLAVYETSHGPSETFGRVAIIESPSLQHAPPVAQSAAQFQKVDQKITEQIQTEQQLQAQISQQGPQGPQGPHMAPPGGGR